MTIFNLPDLGEGLVEAEIREWHVKEGDFVNSDDLLVSMETAKAVVDVPAPHSGQIIKLYGKVGDTISMHAPLIEFQSEQANSSSSMHSSSNENKNFNLTLEQPHPASRPKVLPAVRALAQNLGVDLNQVKGTGPQGQITLSDINAFSKLADLSQQENTAISLTCNSSAYTPVSEETNHHFTPLRGVRKSMAIAMSQSHKEVVPVTLMDDADIYQWPSKTDITLRLLRAITLACQAEPSLNSWYDGKEMALAIQPKINIGLAMDTPEGLFVPVLNDVAAANQQELRATINRLKVEVKARTVSSQDLQGHTITLSNFGMFAGRYANPIVVPPTVAIIGAGRVRDELVWEIDKPKVHRILPLSLTVDHRAITGGEASRFLAILIKDLQLAM